MEIFSKSFSIILVESFFPNNQITKIALRVLNLPATSASCERNFKTYANIKTKKRNRLTIERTNKLAFIKYNLKFIKNKLALLDKEDNQTKTDSDNEVDPIEDVLSSEESLVESESEGSVWSYADNEDLEDQNDDEDQSDQEDLLSENSSFEHSFVNENEANENELSQMETPKNNVDVDPMIKTDLFHTVFLKDGTKIVVLRDAVDNNTTSTNN